MRPIENPRNSRVWFRAETSPKLPKLIQRRRFDHLDSFLGAHLRQPESADRHHDKNEALSRDGQVSKPIS